MPSPGRTLSLYSEPRIVSSAETRGMKHLPVTFNILWEGPNLLPVVSFALALCARGHQRPELEPLLCIQTLQPPPNETALSARRVLDLVVLVVWDPGGHASNPGTPSAWTCRPPPRSGSGTARCAQGVPEGSPSRTRNGKMQKKNNPMGSIKKKPTNLGSNYT